MSSRGKYEQQKQHDLHYPNAFMATDKFLKRHIFLTFCLVRLTTNEEGKDNSRTIIQL